MALEERDLPQVALLGSETGAVDLPQTADAKLLALFVSTKARRSEQTARVYGSELRRFLAFVGKPLPAVTFEDVSRFADSIAHLAPASQARALTTVRSFFRFGVRIGLLPLNPAEPLELPKVDVRSGEHFLTKAEARALADAARAHSPKANAFVLLALTTGLRVSEMIGATWADVFTDPEGRVGLTVMGKGGKRRAVKLTPGVLEALQAARVPGAEPLLANRQGGSMSAPYLRRLLDVIAKKAGIAKDLSPHWLRHTAATLALANGAPLLRVKEDLGHGSLGTTQRYLHAAKGLENTSADYIDFED